MLENDIAISESEKTGSVYLVELEHKPEMCITSGGDRNKSHAAELMAIRDTARELGTRIVGGWSFPVGHRLWYVVEANDAHAVAELARTCQLHSWNTVTVNPVLDHDSFSEKILGKLVDSE